MPEVAINCRAVNNQPMPGSSFKYAVQQRCKVTQNNARNGTENLEVPAVLPRCRTVTVAQLCYCDLVPDMTYNVFSRTLNLTQPLL